MIIHTGVDVMKKSVEQMNQIHASSTHSFVSAPSIAITKRKVIRERTVDDVSEKNRNIPSQYTAGLNPNGSYETNPYGFIVRTTAKGSMEPNLFLDYAKHFVDHLPKHRPPGKDGAIILILDGHNSRWSLPGLYYLWKNNVFPFFIPSHTSIVAQPNDNNPNKTLHQCISNSARNLAPVLKRLSSWSMNTIIFDAWTQFLKNEKDELLNSGRNNTTAAYMLCGYYPYNPNCCTWEAALKKGISNLHGICRKKLYQITPRPRNEIKDGFLHDNPSDDMQTLLHCSDDLLPDFKETNDQIVRYRIVLKASYERAEGILKR